MYTCAKRQVYTWPFIFNDAEHSLTATSFGLSLDPGAEMEDGATYTFEFAMLDASGSPCTVTATWNEMG